ncbi:MAG TPA: hypothetical protein GX393_05290 [Firmicutes bacterium]|nr:hypothetical protein [Bacillota bacterium]
MNGNAGARLFAHRGGLIDRVVITAGTPFAIAQVRYGLRPDLTFTAALALLITVILAVILA